MTTTVVLIAKEPIPGKVKTRLQTHLSPGQAAEFAAASIRDTAELVRSLPADRRILLFEGERVPSGGEGLEVVRQVCGGLDERLAAIFDDCTGPTLLIGMDTPQLSPDDVASFFHPRSGIDAWFGPATDGGFWALGMRDPRGDLIRGVPMSRDDTGAIQYQRLIDAGLDTAILPRLTDVDTWDDALVVARLAPRTHAAATIERFTRGAVA